MTPEERSLRLSRHVRFRIIAGECVVVDQNASTVAVLNKAGGRVLEMLRDGCNRAQLVTRTAERYRISQGVARRDLDGFLSQISHQEWLVEQP